MLEEQKLCNLLDFELVLVFPIQIYHFVAQPCFLHCFLEVGQWRKENIIIAALESQLSFAVGR